MTTTVRWEVQTQLAANNWANLWVAKNEETGIEMPVTFPNQQQAEQAMADHKKELAEECPEALAEYRVVSVYVEPAPAKYTAGTRFKVLEPNKVGATMEVILSYVYHNGETYRYHLGMVLGPVGSEVPPLYQHCRLQESDGVQFVDYTTIDEAEVEQHKLPDDLGAARFILRSHADDRLFWMEGGGWCAARKMAKVYTWDDMMSSVKPSHSYYQLVLEGA